MKSYILAFTAAVALAAGLTSQGAVSPEEAAHLGKDLTPIGAEKAGNKDGTISEYTGGLTTPPPDFKPGSGLYPDPFKDEKPLFSITGANMAQYADKLSEGQKELLKRRADYRMDVYPSHRTLSYPQHVLDDTVKNATRASLTSGGIGVSGAEDGYPFPIPKNGYEVMWNHLLRYEGDVYDVRQFDCYAGENGREVLTGDVDVHVESPYYQPHNPQRSTVYFQIYANYHGPGALSGQQFSYVDPLDFSKDERHAWQYVPGQRRTKVAPELAYDTLEPSAAGAVTFDDISVFSGKMDRYSFKLVGKKEMYIPYNEFKFNAASLAAEAGKGFPNPDLMRWELHRVWVVEAELLPGKRHIYKKRVFYWDEDGYGSGMADEYDNADKLLRFAHSTSFPLYDKAIPYTFSFVDIDFSGNRVVISATPAGMPIFAGASGPGHSRAWTAAELSPDAMSARGIR
jgi:hypothetical protein